MARLIGRAPARCVRAFCRIVDCWSARYTPSFPPEKGDSPILVNPGAVPDPPSLNVPGYFFFTQPPLLPGRTLVRPALLPVRPSVARCSQDRPASFAFDVRYAPESGARSDTPSPTYCEDE